MLNIPKHEIIKIFPYTHWVGFEDIDNSHDFPLFNVDSVKNNGVIISTYNGNGGIHYHDNGYRFGCTFSIAKTFSLPTHTNYHVFSTNLNIVHDNFTALPYGVLDVTPEVLSKDILCYARFTSRTNMNHRRVAREFCDRSKYITCDFLDPQPGDRAGPNQTEETLERYFTSLNRAKFTICPPGNGSDTYRVWEALYCNCIPIVLDSPLYQNFNELPILRVNKWDELNENMLNVVYEKYIGQEWRSELLYKSYYRKKC